MTLTQHGVLTGVVAAVLATTMSAVGVLTFAVGSILIDMDHYFLYVQRTRRFGIRGMFRYFDDLQAIQKTIPYLGLCVFHTLDFFLMVAMVSFFYPVVLTFLAGCLFHYLLDFVDLYRKGVLFIRPYFILEHVIRRRSEGYPWY